MTENGEEEEYDVVNETNIEEEREKLKKLNVGSTFGILENVDKDCDNPHDRSKRSSSKKPFT